MGAAWLAAGSTALDSEHEVAQMVQTSIGAEASDGLLPPRLLTRLRPELPDLCEDIIAEICRVIPSYEPLISGSLREPVEDAVRSNVDTFVDQLTASPSPSPAPARDELCRELGRMHAPLDDGLSRLERAFQVGVRVTWQRIIPLLEQYDVPAPAQAAMADGLFGYFDEMVGLARDGFLDVRELPFESVEHHRHHLLHGILEGASEPSLDVLAHRVGWPQPDRVTVLVVDGAAPGLAGLDRSVLVDLACPLPTVVVPGDLDAAGRASVCAAVGDRQVAVGPTVAIGEAAESLRWARQAQRLVECGVLPAAPLVLCDDHLLTLWLSAAPWLSSQLLHRQVEPFDQLPEHQRERMLHTLAAWLSTQGDAHRMAEDLGVHPQTVRNRVRSMRALLGDALDDPDWRICTELTLRRRAFVGQVEASILTRR